MAEPSSSRLDLLYRISQTINSSLNLDEVMESLIDEVISVTNAERGFLMLFNDAGNLEFRTARGMDQQTIEESDFKISRGIVEQVAVEGMPLLTSNAQLDQRLETRASVKLFGLRSVLCVPIIQKGEVLGVIYVDNRFQNGIFSQEDLELLNSIASSAGIAIDNARLYRIAVEKGRMERELQMARDVQRSLIPPEIPKLSGWEFAACWRPAHEVSGDYYDFIPIGEEGLGVIVADVSDKGMPAAMFMALSRSVIRSVVGQGGDPSSEITKANHLIWRDSSEGTFITLFYAQLNQTNGEISYVNAGQNPPLVYRSKSGEFIPLKRTGMAAGVEGDTRYEDEKIKMEPGDILLMYTDGVTDALVEKGKLGEEHLKKTVSLNDGLPPLDLVKHLEEEVCGIPANGDPVDDVTILIAKKIT